jgi:hypothetical protein
MEMKAKKGVSVPCCCVWFRPDQHPVIDPRRKETLGGGSKE